MRLRLDAPPSPRYAYRMPDDPPWLDVTLHDYRWTPSGERRPFRDVMAAAHALIQRQVDGEIRIRLILREARDLAGETDDARSRQNPYSIGGYDVGTDAMTICATEVVIEMRDGTRYPVQAAPGDRYPIWANGVRGGLKPGRWTTHPLATRYRYETGHKV